MSASDSSNAYAPICLRPSAQSLEIKFGHRPAHYASTEHIEHVGEVHEPRRGRDIGDLGNPRLVGCMASKRRSTRSGAERAFRSRRVVRGPLRGLTPPTLRRTSPEPRACGSPACPVRAARCEFAAAPYVPTAAPVNRLHTRTRRLVTLLTRRACTLTPCVVPVSGDTEHSGHGGDSELASGSALMNR